MGCSWQQIQDIWRRWRDCSACKWKNAHALGVRAILRRVTRIYRWNLPMRFGVEQVQWRSNYLDASKGFRDSPMSIRPHSPRTLTSEKANALTTYRRRAWTSDKSPAPRSAFSDYEVAIDVAGGHIPQILVKSSFCYPLICRNSPF